MDFVHDQLATGELMQREHRIDVHVLQNLEASYQVILVIIGRQHVRF
jgi:hypothetical protein